MDWVRKRLRVEVDISDLDFGTYYRDDKSEGLEKHLRNDSKYAECMVKREYWDDDTDHNPYVIIDTDGNIMISLEKWEVDALNGPEIISFIEVQRRRDDCSDRLELASLVIFAGSSLFTIGMFPFLFPVFVSDTTPTPVSWLFLAPTIICLISGAVYYIRRKKTHSKMMHIDLDAAREDSTFLEALRKLSAVSDSEYVDKNEYVTRLEVLENLLKGSSF